MILLHKSQQQPKIKNKSPAFAFIPPYFLLLLLCFIQLQNHRKNREAFLSFNRGMRMRRKIWVLVLEAMFLLQYCFLGLGAPVTMEEKAEAAMPMTTAMSPPEGNTTFLDGTSWCVARPGVSQIDLQNALDWACGLGKADCRAIQKGGACYQPDTLLSHASYAFNSFYQQNGNSDIACNFGGSAILTKKNPSYGKCDYSASSSVNSAPSKLKNNGRHVWVKLVAGILMVLNLCFGSS